MRTSKNKAAEVFDKLKPLLESRDAACLDLLDDVRTIPEAAVLAKLVEGYDFSTALKVLASLRVVLGV